MKINGLIHFGISILVLFVISTSVQASIPEQDEMSEIPQSWNTPQATNLTEEQRIEQEILAAEGPIQPKKMTQKPQWIAKAKLPVRKFSKKK